MSELLLIVITPLLWGQPAGQEPERIENFAGELWRPEKDGLKLVARVRAVEGYIRERDINSFSGELRNGRVTYFTEPRDPKEMSQEVSIDFGRGAIDRKHLQFDLSESVVVTMKDGTRIETASLQIDSPKQTLSTPDTVQITQANARLTGIGLIADDTLRQLTLQREGSIVIRGRPTDVVAGSRSTISNEDLLTRLQCAGPLIVRDLSLPIPNAPKLLRVSARDQVQMERTQMGRTVRATSDSLVLYTQRMKESSGTEQLLPLSFTLRDNIVLSDPVSQSRLCAASVDWSFNDDLLRLSGAPFVEATKGGQVIRSHTAIVDRWAQCTSFRGEPSATLALPDAPDQPLHLKAREIDLLSEQIAGESQPTTFQAVGEVKLEGVSGQGGGKIDAAGETFTWNILENHGLLRGVPLARVEQGESRVESPEIVLEGNSLFVVKGPKRLHLVQTEPPDTRKKTPARRMEVHVTAVGDVIVNRATGLVMLSDRCRVRTPEYFLSADRLHLYLSPDGSSVREVRAYGAVRVEREGLLVLGDTLTTNPQTHIIEVRANPHVFASVGNLDARHAIMRINLDTERITCLAGPAGGELRFLK